MAELTGGYMLLALLLAAQPPAIVRTPPPVFNPVPIQSGEKYGQWSYYPGKEYAISSTTNGSGSAMGVICGNSCAVFVNFTTSCQQDHHYPVLINSSGGALHLNLRCHVVDGKYLLSTPATGDILDAIESGGEIGFALPLDSGRFNVSRFSLGGAVPAIKRAVEFAKAQTDNGKSMRDFTL